MKQNSKFLSIHSLPALLTPLPLITTEEMTGCTNEGANKVPRNPPSCCFFLISCFTVSVTPSIDTLESSNEFIILIISFISLFGVNKVHPFPALTAPFPLTFLSNLFITFEVKFLTNPGKLFLGKGIVIFVKVFSPKLPNQEPKDPPDSIILNI